VGLNGRGLSCVLSFWFPPAPDRPSACLDFAAVAAGVIRLRLLPAGAQLSGWQ